MSKHTEPFKSKDDDRPPGVGKVQHDFNFSSAHEPLVFSHVARFMHPLTYQGEMLPETKQKIFKGRRRGDDLPTNFAYIIRKRTTDPKFATQLSFRSSRVNLGIESTHVTTIDYIKKGQIDLLFTGTSKWRSHLGKDFKPEFLYWRVIDCRALREQFAENSDLEKKAFENQIPGALFKSFPYWKFKTVNKYGKAMDPVLLAHDEVSAEYAPILSKDILFGGDFD